MLQRINNGTETLTHKSPKAEKCFGAFTPVLYCKTMNFLDVYGVNCDSFLAYGLIIRMRAKTG